MASSSVQHAVEVTKEEHSLGELSSANLQAAQIFFDSDGVVAWQCLWPQDNHEAERRALDVLRGLPAEKDFIYVNVRSQLPREIVYNKFITDFLMSQFPTARLLQIYARHATRAGTLSLQSSHAIAPLLVQILVAHNDHPLSVKVESGGRCIYLNGNGLAIVRSSSKHISVHIESKDYTVVSLDYALSEGS